MHRGLWQKSHEIDSDGELNTNQKYLALAYEAIKILDEYYGSARYWMAAEFERERVLRQIQDKIDEIRDANLSLQ